MKKSKTAIKISHEVPISMLKNSRNFNDYCYCLAHLYATEPEYKEYYQKASRGHRHVLLDNSIFELGESFDPDEYAKIIRELKPTEYIVPDVLEDADGTIENFENWKANHLEDLPGTPIGVVQGKTYRDIKRCMMYMIENVHRIAISFDYSYYLTIGKGSNDWEKYADGRNKLLQSLDNDLLLPYNKSYHLLGCSIPSEFVNANNFIFVKHMFHTMDTSNPIVHGILGRRYDGVNGEDGLPDKQTIKLADLIHTKPTREQMNDIRYNIRAFRGMMDQSSYCI